MKKICTSALAVFLTSLVYSQTPTYTWAKQIQGNSGYAETQSIDVDPAGNICVTGLMSGTVDFDPGAGTYNLVSPGGAQCCYVAKYDANGSLLWAKNWGGTVSWQVVNGHGVSFDGTGNIFVTGIFNGVVDFDPTPAVSTYSGVSTQYAIFVCKYSSSGTFLWAKAIIPSTASCYPDAGIKTDAAGNFVIAGRYNSTCDFDMNAGTYSLTSIGTNYDAFFAKYDNNGNFIFAKSVGGTGGDFVNDLHLDANANIFIGGYYNLSGTAGSDSDFDPGIGVSNLTSSFANAESYFAKYDSNGNYILAKAINGSLGDYVTGISADPSGNIFISGYFAGTTDFDPGAGAYTLTASANNSMFFGRYDASGNFDWANSLSSTNSCGTRANIEYDINGNIVFGGEFTGTLDADASAASYMLNSLSTSGTAFVCLYSNTGAFQSAFSIGGTGSNQNYFNEINASNSSIHICGMFLGTQDFDPSSTTNNLVSTGTIGDGYFAKYSNTCTASPITPSGISGSINICSGSTNTYSVAAVSGATSYSWTLPGGWSGTSSTNSISATAGASGTISVTANNACGSSSAATLSVTVSTAPSTPSSIAGSNTVCSGSSQTYTVTNDPSATGYTWTLPSGWSGTSSTNSISTTAGASGTISVTANNTCGSSVAQTLNITVNDVPAQPSSLVGNTTICNGTTQTYTVTNDPSVTGYTWTLPSGWTGTSTTNSITASAGTSGTITVTANNICGSSSATTLSVTVNSAPAMPGAISGVTTVCSASANTYSVSPVSGAVSYLWTIPANWSGSSTTNNITVTTDASTTLNTYTISVAAQNTCGTSPAQDLILSFSSPSSQIILATDTVCSGSPVSISATDDNANIVNYNWFTSSQTICNGSTCSSITPSPTSNETYSLTVTDANGCIKTYYQDIIVLSLPAITYTQNPALICVNNGSITLSTATPAGGSYSGTGVSGNSFDPAASGTGLFYITYVYTDANGCTNSDSSGITVDACLGLNNLNNLNEQFVLYPNPTSGRVYIVSASKEMTPVSVHVYNAIGEEMNLTVFSDGLNNKCYVDLSELRAGMYFITTDTNTGVFSWRIIKE